MIIIIALALALVGAGVAPAAALFPTLKTGGLLALAIYGFGSAPGVIFGLFFFRWQTIRTCDRILKARTILGRALLCAAENRPTMAEEYFRAWARGLPEDMIRTGLGIYDKGGSLISEATFNQALKTAHDRGLEGVVTVLESLWAEARRNHSDTMGKILEDKVNRDLETQS